jgi:probable F420-dependent oxidoreductase
MKIDAALPPVGLKEVPKIAGAVEATGFDCLWSTETMHDPFLPGALIAAQTKYLHFGTAVAIAFARSPATIAYSAWDLAEASGGRFILGLGTQVKAHVERRFGLPWPDSPVQKLREQIAVLRAFWECWQQGGPMNYQGEYYRLDLMSPFFNPGPIPNPQIPIFIAGVNKGLAQLAGETADGFHVHPFHTPEYLRRVLIPAIESGATRSGRTPDSIQVSVTAFSASSQEDRFFVKSQIAFYASTPSYRPVMQLHGWEDIAQRLSRLAARGRWEEMPQLIDDEILSTFSVTVAPEEVGTALLERYRGLADRLTLYIPFRPGERDVFWKQLIREVNPGNEN